MNTKQILAVIAVATAMSAPAAIAQIAPVSAPAAPAASAPAAAPVTQKNKGKEKHEMKFEERKAKALQHLEKRAAEVQQKQACVQASTDSKSLESCFPNREKWEERERKEHGEGKPEAAAPAGK